jgi:hypothetical protein
VAVAIYGLTPMEGEVRGLLWIYRLRARMEREVEGLEPFASATDGRADVVPLVLLDEEHGVALATEVEA